MEKYIDILLLTVLICLGVCLFFALLRAIRGPRLADRIIGINMVGSLTVAAIAVLAVKLHQSWLLDVSLIYCMISFLAVVVLAKVNIAANGDKKGTEDDNNE